MSHTFDYIETHLGQARKLPGETSLASGCKQFKQLISGAQALEDEKETSAAFSNLHCLIYFLP